MSLTRFNDDAARIKKKLQEMTGASAYQLNAPGPGVDMPFFEDPQIRLQKWGANLRNNTTNLESDLIGINRKATKKTVEYGAMTPSTSSNGYGSSAAFVDETRASNPAWTLRDLEQFIIGYSRMDRSTEYKVVDKKWFETMFNRLRGTN